MFATQVYFSALGQMDWVHNCNKPCVSFYLRSAEHWICCHCNVGSFTFSSAKILFGRLCVYCTVLTCNRWGRPGCFSFWIMFTSLPLVEFSYMTMSHTFGLCRFSSLALGVPQFFLRNFKAADTKHWTFSFFWIWWRETGKTCSTACIYLPRKKWRV